MKLRTLVCASLAVLFALAETAFATIISTNIVQQGGTPPILNNTFGTVKVAYNFGGGDLTRDGIDFTGFSFPDEPPAATVTTSPFNIELLPEGASGKVITSNLGGDPLFETEIWTWGSASATPLRLTVTGLDPAETYQIQVMHGDPRSAFTYNNRTVTFESTSDTVTGQLTFGGNNANHRFALVTATVTNTTSFSYHMVHVSGRGPSMSGVVVQYTPIPEPASASLIALCGGLAIALVGRRRR